MQPFAGVYYHSVCHTGDGFYHSSTGQSGFRISSGGWHDAGDYGKYIVSIGLLLFAFSTAISWSYYGGRAVTFIWGVKYEKYYRIVYVLGFFVASFTDTTIIWTFSGIAIALMTLPNLFGILLLHKEMKASIHNYWVNFAKSNPEEKLPYKIKK